MQPGTKLVLAFLGGVVVAVIALHTAWQMHNQSVLDLSDLIAAYETTFTSEKAARKADTRDDLTQRVEQLASRISSLETALLARQDNAIDEELATAAPAIPKVVTEVQESNDDVDIEVLNWEWTVSPLTAKYVAAKGLVRNTSDKQLEGVYAVVEWHDAQGSFLASEDMPLNISPLPPGETASFHVPFPRDSRMHSARLRFRTMRGKIVSSADSVRVETLIEDPPLTE